MQNSQIIAIVLKRVRRRVKLVDVATGLISLAAFAFLFLLIEVICDHLFVLQRQTRLVFLSVLKISTLLIVSIGAFFPLLRRIRNLYIAKLIEDAYPDIKNSLTSFLQVRQEVETPPDALKVLEHETAKHLVHVRPAAVVSTRRFMWSGYLLIAAMVVSFAYSILSPKSVLPPLKRALLPGRDIDPATKTIIASVKPGKNTPRVLENSPVGLLVKIRGVAPKEVSVRWREGDGEWWRKSLTKGDRQRWRGRIEDVGKGARYFITAGDTKSDMFKIKTVPPPVVQKIDVELDENPKEPGPTRRSVGGDISAARNSLATVKARTNHRLRRAVILTDSGKKIKMALSSDGRRPTGKIFIDREDKYQIALLDEYGHENTDPPKYVISCWERKKRENEPEEEKPAEVARLAHRNLKEGQPADRPSEEKGDKSEDGNDEDGQPPAAQDRPEDATPEQRVEGDAGEDDSTEVELAKLIEENKDKLEEIAEALRKKEEREHKKPEGAEQDKQGRKQKKQEGNQQSAASKGKQKQAETAGSRDRQKKGVRQTSESASKAQKARGSDKKSGAARKKPQSARSKAGSGAKSKRTSTRSPVQSGARKKTATARGSQGGEKSGAASAAKSGGGKGKQQPAGTSQSKSAKSQSGRQGKSSDQAKAGKGATGRKSGGASQAKAGSRQSGGKAQAKAGEKTGGQQGTGASKGKPGEKGQQQGASSTAQSQGSGTGKAQGGQGSAQGPPTMAKRDGEKGQQPGAATPSEGGGQTSGQAAGRGPTTRNRAGTEGDGGEGGTRGEDTLGTGRNIDTVVTLAEKLIGIVDAPEIDKEFLGEIDMSDQQFRTLVSSINRAIARYRNAQRATTDGTAVIRRDGTTIGVLRGGTAAARMSKGASIGQDEKRDDLNKLLVDRRNAVSPEYRDMVDEYFRVISAQGSTALKQTIKE